MRPSRQKSTTKHKKDIKKHKNKQREKRNQEGKNEHTAFGLSARFVVIMGLLLLATWR